MMNFLKPAMAPGEPVEFELSMQIEASAAVIYALVDWASPRNAKRELGELVEQIASEPESYRLRMMAMADLAFDCEVTENVPGRRYAYRCRITPSVGRLAGTHERFTFDPLGPRACRVTLLVSAQFLPMELKFLEGEVSLMAAACRDNLSKLKIHAEYGAEAVRLAEAEEVARFELRP